MLPTRIKIFLVLLLHAWHAHAGLNGMALRPPMGWRSWNEFGCNVSQPDILAAAYGLADTSRKVDGQPTSLLSLGYSNVGLDDCWQELLVDSCHYPGSGFSDNAMPPLNQRPPCSDPSKSFNVSYDNQQCMGLSGPLPGISTSQSCAAACCADDGCEIWQFCAAGLCGGSAAPLNSCYTGAIGSCQPSPGWVSRGTAGYTFHDDQGRPVVNTTRFPNMKAMTDTIHSLGLTAGWYGNNCFCRDHCSSQACFEGDVSALVGYGFDTVKYDGCSAERDISRWAGLINATSKGPNAVIENCNNDNSKIPRKGDDPLKAPMHFYRTSTDIRPTYGSIANNGQSILTLRSYSGPHCWGYPDMLEVGVTATILTGQKVPAAPRREWGETVALPPNSREYLELAARAPLPPVLNFVENRAHFSMWTILSSPLVLSLNFSNSQVVDSVWPIITNKDAIAVNQAWAGSLGGLLYQSSDMVTLPHCAWIWAGDPNCTLPAEQQLYKPLPGGGAAVLVMNHGVNLTSIPGLQCQPGPCSVRDIWLQADLPAARGVVPVPSLQSHDVAYFIVQ